MYMSLSLWLPVFGTTGSRSILQTKILLFVADRKLATSLIVPPICFSFDNYSHFSLLDLIWKAHFCLFKQQANGASSLGYAGRRTGSEGIQRIPIGYEIPSFEGIMSHHPLKRGEISVDHLKRPVYVYIHVA